MNEVILDSSGMKRTLGRMAHEILELNGGGADLVVVGILRRGYPVAKRLAFTMTQIEGATIPCGKLDTSSSRDDRKDLGENTSEIPFEVTNKTVILVDEVIFTGRTVRAAMDALRNFGRPNRIHLAVLIDRGHRELPIQPDFVGKAVNTERGDHIEVRVFENEGEDAVLLVQGSIDQAVMA